MKSIIIILLTTSIWTQSFACYNEYNINLRGQGRMNMDERLSLSIFYQSFDLEFSKEYVTAVDLSKKELYDYKDLSDISIHLCRLGRVQEALKLLKWLHEKYPNEYKIVSNLGTTYELAGDLDKAQEYLLKAIEMNPNSHHGSEWFHLKILNAKKHWNNDVNWLLENNILDLGNDIEIDFGNDSYKAFRDTVIHIKIQLKERIPFTPENDIIMAKILIEYGDYLATHFSVRQAGVIYRMANTYDKNNVFRVRSKISKVDKIVAKNRKKYVDNKTPNALFKLIFPPKEEFREIDRKYIDEIKTDSMKAKLPTTEKVKTVPEKINNHLYGWIAVIVVFFISLFLFVRRR